MVRVRVLCFATLLALAVTAPAQFGDRIRPPRIDVDLPGIEDLLFKKESPLSTSLKDVTTEGWPVFDGYDPVEVKDLKSAPLDDRGRFVLTPGVWKGTIDSFCGRSASYGPQRGLGYLLGPWKGPKAFSQGHPHGVGWVVTRTYARPARSTSDRPRSFLRVLHAAPG